MFTSNRKKIMSIRKQIQELEIEANSNLQLYLNNQDNNALRRYEYLLSAIRVLRSKTNEK